MLLSGERNNIMLMGDFNAVVGCQGSENTGKFGLGKRNERGLDRLVEFFE